MPALGLDEIQIAKAGECPAHGFQSQADKISNIGPTEGKRKLGEMLFARGKLVREPEEETTHTPFGIGARGGQERRLPLLHDARDETLKLGANQLVLGDTPQQVPVRDNTEDRILKGNHRNGLCPGRSAEKTNHITSQCKRRDLKTPVDGSHHGF